MAVFFHAPRFYNCLPNHEWMLYGRSQGQVREYIERSLLTELFVAEQALREHTQREETLQRKVRALEKLTALKYDWAELEKTIKQLEDAEAEYPQKEYALYRVGSILPPILKELYDSLRRDNTWYMREEMVQDCSDQGGCCSRGCGCCSQRHSFQKKKISGHCTTECWCCINFRGFDLPEHEKEKIRKDFRERLRLHNSCYLMNLANWFFCPVRLKISSKLKSKWDRLLSTLRR